MTDIETLIFGENKEKLVVIERLTQARLKTLIGVQEVPAELEYMVTEVSIKRFNRLRNEGMKSYSEEGESFSFPDSDFDEFAADIQNWKESNGKTKRGRVIFV